MNIQKEREAFEEYMLLMTDGSFNTTKNHLTDQYAFGVNQTFWAIWQAAKSQAVPEGFVLVSKEPTEKMNKAGLREYSKLMGVGQDDIGYIYKAMIEAAQELSGD